jgi:hypothetical protein
MLNRIFIQQTVHFSVNSKVFYFLFYWNIIYDVKSRDFRLRHLCYAGFVGMHHTQVSFHASFLIKTSILEKKMILIGQVFIKIWVSLFFSLNSSVITETNSSQISAGLGLCKSNNN